MRDQDQEDDDSDDAEQDLLSQCELDIAAGAGVTLRKIRHSREFDIGIRCDGLSNARCYQLESAGKVALAEDGHDLTPEAADLPVRQDAFQAIAHFNAILVVLRGQQYEDATVSAFCAYAPLFVQSDGKVFDRFVLKRLDRDDGDLGVRFLLDFKAKSIERVFRIGA